MKHAEPMNLHATMVNAYKSVGAAIGMMTVVMAVMNFRVHQQLALKQILNVLIMYAYHRNGNVMEKLIVWMVQMKG